MRGRYGKSGVLEIYYANVRAVLEYGSVVWSRAASSHLQRRERIQHNFLCLLAGTRRDRFDMSDYDSLCLSYKINKLEKRRSAPDFAFLHGVLSGRTESPLLLSQFLRIPVRVTHNPEFLFVPACRTVATRSALFFRLPRAFNTILVSARRTNTIEMA